MNVAKIEKEISFRSSRSGGKGGQHVNKTETRVELLFDVMASEGLSEWEKQQVLTKLSTYVSGEGELRMVADRMRSQLANKKVVLSRFMELLEKAIIPVKPRKPMRISKAAKQKRLTQKRQQSEKKQNRRRNWS